MLHKLFKNMSQEIQGSLSLILGLILILGTLGKLQILQSLLNSVMIFTGLVLLLWGLNATNGINKIQELFHKKHK